MKTEKNFLYLTAINNKVKIVQNLTYNILSKAQTKLFKIEVEDDRNI